MFHPYTEKLEDYLHYRSITSPLLVSSLKAVTSYYILYEEPTLLDISSNKYINSMRRKVENRSSIYHYF